MEGNADRSTASQAWHSPQSPFLMHSSASRTMACCKSHSLILLSTLTLSETTTSTFASRSFFSFFTVSVTILRTTQSHGHAVDTEDGMEELTGISDVQRWRQIRDLRDLQAISIYGMSAFSHLYCLIAISHWSVCWYVSPKLNTGAR